MRTRPIPASKQSRYLRDTSRAVEALVLSAWYATTGTGLAQPISQLQVQLPTLQEGASSQQPAMAAPVLAEVLDAVRSSPRPEELRAAMSEGIRQAVWKVDGLRGLSSLLGLEEVPARLETWDISHLYGTHTALDEYCCYPIHGVTPADDTGAISAALREHLGSSAGQQPAGLLLLDGGKGQLSSALDALSELGVRRGVAALALAKREEEIYLPGASEPLVLPRSSPTLTLLRRQRDEAHAYALLSHRRLRSSAELASVLDGCGLTAAEQSALRASFGSASALRAASVDELRSALGEDCAADPRLVSARLRSRPEPVAVGFHDSLAGYGSAVQALALSSRRMGSQVEAWASEEQARRWWAARRGVWLSRLERGGPAAERAVDDVLEAVGGLLAPEAPLASEEATTAAASALYGALEAWGSEGALSAELPAKEGELLPGALSAGARPEAAAAAVAEEEVLVGGLGRARLSSAVAMPSAFELRAPYRPSGDQPSAIDSLVADVQSGVPRVVLKGATGTGKTFVLANLIARTNRPTLIVAPNKVLAAQLYTELRSFFPTNAVTIFFSHFDFYRPESYAPVSQNYVEKASQTNPKIDALRHEATRSLFERRDTIVVATVSCIYGLGMPAEYLDRATALSVGQRWRAPDLLAALREMRYERAAGRQLGRGEFLWPGEAGGTAGGEAGGEAGGVGGGVGGGGAGVTLSVHLVHEDRVLDVSMRLVPDGSDRAAGEGTGGVGDGGGGGGEGGPELEVCALRYRDAATGGSLPPPSKAGAEAGAEALIQAVLEEGADPPRADSAAEPPPPPPPLPEARVRALKVAALKEACAERGLATGGVKAALRERLLSHEALLVAAGEAGGEAGEGGDAGAAGDGEGPAHVVLYPANHYTVGQEEHKERVLREIAAECASTVRSLLASGLVVEAERLQLRTESDLADIAREGYCSGMENYSRHLTGRGPGEAPPTLLDYMPDDWLFIADESHITVPQLGAMHAGDHSRKLKLVEGGFRLPSALDNRPLTGEEVWERVPQAVLVSATPGAEMALLCGPSPRVTELVVRPTGIPDPLVAVVDVAPLGGYEDHLLAQIEARVARRERTLVTCITKASAEALSDFLSGHGVSSIALHSGVKPLERLRLLAQLRSGELDVLVGCNLLREGLDLPEVSLVCVLNADKQGLLRSTTSLIQTIGRAARHVNGVALLYSESGRSSEAMEQAIAETNRRRAKQLAHNERNLIVPRAAGTALGADGAAEPRAPDGGGASILEMLARGGQGGGAAGDRGPPGGDLDGEERALYDELRAWRGQVARAGRRRRPFMILTEAVMRGIAVARPSSMDELLDVKGVGPKKAEAYGEEILRLVRASEGQQRAWQVNGQSFVVEPAGGG